MLKKTTGKIKKNTFLKYQLEPIYYNKSSLIPNSNFTPT